MIKPGDKITVNGTTLKATSVEIPLTERSPMGVVEEEGRPWTRTFYEVKPRVIVSFEVVEPDKYRLPA